MLLSRRSLATCRWAMLSPYGWPRTSFAPVVACHSRTITVHSLFGDVDLGIQRQIDAMPAQLSCLHCPGKAGRCDKYTILRLQLHRADSSSGRPLGQRQPVAFSLIQSDANHRVLSPLFKGVGHAFGAGQERNSSVRRRGPLSESP